MINVPADGTGGLGFDSRVGRIRHSVATAMTVLPSCVGQALSRGGGPTGYTHITEFSHLSEEYKSPTTCHTVVLRSFLVIDKNASTLKFS